MAREERQELSRRCAPVMVLRFLPLLLLALSACGSYPRDPDGTLDRVRASHVFRVGLIPTAPGADARAPAFLAAVTNATGARPVTVTGGAEPLLLELEAGKLDLVIGELADDSPWVDRVSILDPLAERTTPSGRVTLHPIAKNGENAWIMLLERQRRLVGGPKR